MCDTKLRHFQVKVCDYCHTREIIFENFFPSNNEMDTKWKFLFLLVGAVGIKISVATDEVRRDRF